MTNMIEQNLIDLQNMRDPLNKYNQLMQENN